jgi:hypothetical protein
LQVEATCQIRTILETLGYPGKAPSLQIEPEPEYWSVKRNEWNPCLSTVLASLEENPDGRLVTSG